MTECIFCQIANGVKDETIRIFYKDSDCFAMLVNNPETRGHFILVTTKHFSQISEMISPEIIFGKAILIAEKKLARLGAKAYTLKLNNKVYLIENNSGHVGHLHIHIIPRYATESSDGDFLRDGNYYESIKKLLIKD